MDNIELTSLTHDILSNANVGLWAVEIDESMPKRMYADQTMCRLLGVSTEETPENTFLVWLNNISPNQKDDVLNAINKMIEGQHAEIQYTWNHPKTGEMYVRCGGTRNPSYNKGIRIEGFHQDISELHNYQLKYEKAEAEVKIEKDKNLRVIDAEQETMKRIMELTEDFESIYDVDVVTGDYSVYTKTGNYTEELIDNLGLSENYFKSNEINIPLAIDPDDQKMMKNHINQDFFMFELPKRKKVELDYRCLIRGKPIWYRMKIVKIGNWNKEKHALVGIFNNEENYLREEKLRMHRMDEEFYKRAILNNAYSYFKVNLSQNKIISQIVEINENQVEDYAYKYGENLPDYDTIIKISAKRYIDSDYKKSFILSLGSKNLINQYLSGNSMPEYICHIYSSKIGWHYRKYVNYLSQDQFTNDILCMTVAYNITEEMRLQEEEKEKVDIINALAKDYTAIYYADLRTNTLNPYILNERILSDVQKQLNTSRNLEVMLEWFIKDYIHPDDREAFSKAFEEVITSKKMKKSFSLFFRRNYGGTYLYTEVQCVKIGDNKKASDSFVLAFAEKDSAFKKEKENQKKLKHDFEIINTLATEYSTVVYVDFNDNKIIPYSSNTKFQKLFDNLKFTNMNINIAFNLFINNFVYEPDKKKVQKEGEINYIREKLRDKKSCELIFRVKTKNGPEYRQMRYIKIDDPNEEPTAIALALADRNDDIINRFINTQILNEYSAVYYLDIETETARSIKISSKINFLQSNTSNYKRLITSFIPFVAPEYQDIWKKLSEINYVKSFLKDEDSREMTYQVVNDDNDWHRSEWQVIERKNGNPSVVIVYFRQLDINTAQTLELTNKITAQNLELETKQKQLEDALSLAQSANRAKTTFLNNMSHDIRTPMNAILGFTGLASTHVDNPDQVRNYLAKISQSSEHLLSLINDVLDMSRIESGKMNLTEHPENLAEILHSLRDIIQSEVNAKKLELVIDTVNITDENIICDKLRLNQVLLNIISNAIKYTHSGGKISISISQISVSKNGYAVYEFRIKDNGIGMSKEFIDTIFEPFTREKSATISGIQGTGLGMSITKNIIDMMGGKIEVNSERGVGSEFIITLDFKLTDQNSHFVKIPQMEDAKCLIIDDNISTCQSVSKMLKDFGITCEWRTSLKEGLELAEESILNKEPFKVFISNWDYAGTNGIEIAKKLRSVIGDEPKILILTASDISDMEDDAKSSGISSIISKPIFPSDLQNALLKCCGSNDSVNDENMYKNISGKHILLVEDNAFNQEIATEILNEAGLIVDVAYDGSIAVNKISKSKPGTYDAVLMDIQMPVMDGYEATRQIRNLRNKKLANIPIIAMTANAFEEDKEKAFDAGMNGHLSKPIDINKMLSVLELITKK